MPVPSSDEATIRPSSGAAYRHDQDEFIDLTEIAAMLLRNWITLVICVLIALAAAAALFMWLPARWQALTTIEIGQVPLGTPVSGSRGTALIESPPQTAERVKQRDLTNTVLSSLGIPTDQPEERRAALLRSTLKATIVKNTNFIQLGVAGYSPEEAQASLAAAARVLMESHNRLMIPTVARMMAQLKDNEKQLAEAQSERARLQELLNDAEKSHAKIDFAPNIVAVSQLANKDAQIRQIIAQRAELEDTMASSRTYPTRIVDAVYVEPRPYFPKPSLFVAVAVLLGLIVGAALAFYRDRKKAARHTTA